MKKKIPVFTIIILLAIVLVLYFIRNLKNTNITDTDEIIYSDYNNDNLNLSFIYPSDWEIKDEDIDTYETFQSWGLKIYDENKFVVEMYSHKESEKDNVEDLCEKYKDCGISEEKVILNCNDNIFEQISSLGDSEILVSRTGVYEFISEDFEDCTFVDSDFKLNTPYRLMERYDNGISEHMSILGHNGVNDKFVISYTFYNQDAFENWDEYKEIIQKIVGSIKYAGV